MDDKLKNSEVEQTNSLEKLKWETPKLICLDKGKTEGGGEPGNPEDDSYSPGPS
ncbi:MAG: hypothetical protein AB7S50_15275 [Bacteroidales bacterium]